MNLRNQITTGDCLELLATCPPKSVQLAFADPPFNIGYGYDVYIDRMDKPAYLNWTKKWLMAVKRVLAPTGSVYVAIGDEYAAEMKLCMDAMGWTMRNWIVWHYTFGVNCTHKFNRSHAHIFYYVADEKKFTFNADAIRVASARQTTYGDVRANPRGKLPDDTWVLRPTEEPLAYAADSDTWAVPRVCGTFKERGDHPCQMPIAVLERIIRVSSNIGDIVLDPFSGSGTTLAAAKKWGRDYIGIELSENYAQQARDRLDRVVLDEQAHLALAEQRRATKPTKRTHSTT